MPTIHDPAVSLTDAALGAEAAWFAARLGRRPSVPHDARRQALRRSFVGFFVATSVASTAGAILHGLVPDRTSLVHRMLWRTSLIAIGAGALTGWSIGARLLLPAAPAARVERLAATEFVAYALVAAATTLPYRAAIANYLPAAAFLGIGFIPHARRPGGGPAAGHGLAGLGLTAVAAVVQARNLRIGPRWLDHNALYHLIQAVAIAAFHRSATRLLDEAPTEGAAR